MVGHREANFIERPAQPRETERTPDPHEREAQPGRRGGSEERQRELECERDLQRERPREREIESTPASPLT